MPVLVRLCQTLFPGRGRLGREIFSSACWTSGARPLNRCLRSDARNPRCPRSKELKRLMTYEHDLAFNMRLRGVTEQQIAEAIDEVAAHTMSTGTPPELEFGTPEEYAASFPKARRKSRGVRVVMVAAVLSFVYVVATFALKALIDFDVRTWTGPITLWPALVIVGAGLLVGFLFDYLRPKPSVADRRQPPAVR